MKTINKIYTITIALIMIATVGNAHQSIVDTVVLKFRNNVNIVVVTDSENNLESALSYDLNKIIEDLKYKIRMSDDKSLTIVVEDEYGENYLMDTVIFVDRQIFDEDEDFDPDADYERSEPNWEQDRDRDRGRDRNRENRRRTRNYYNIDLGMNNYLEDGNFPDGSNALYTVRPWGSWYIGMATLFKTKVVGPLYIEWGGGIDWYSFKFENNRTRMEKTDLGLTFSEDIRTEISPVKSKLSAAYLTARFIPVFDFSRGGHRDRDRLWNEDIGNGLRFGLGPYAGYRIDSWTKNVYEEGDKQKDKNNSNYYLNNFRYGARFQIGWKGVDLFANYDVSELFTNQKDTPKLNAFSFGFTM